MVGSSEQVENLDALPTSTTTGHFTGSEKSTPQKADSSDSANPSEWQVPKPGELESGKENENAKTTGECTNLVR